MGRGALAHTAAALFFTGMALALRLPRLGDTPGWDGDEAYNLEIAWQLLDGRAQAFAVSQSFVQHPVLFYAVLSPLLGVLGRDLLVARVLAAVATSLGVGLSYLAVRSNAGTRAGVFAALVLAGAHFVVLHNRLAYTYNLLLVWCALTLWCATRWEETRHAPWLFGAAAGAALGFLTDQVGVALPVFLAARAWPRRRLAVGVLAAGMLPALTAAVAMLALQPEAALQDWGKSLARVSTESPGLQGGPATRLALWFVNYLHLLRAEWWMPLAVAGLFCLPEAASRRRVLALAGLLAVPVFALREVDPFFRTAIPLLLPAALGCGALLDTGLHRVRATVTAPAARAALAAFAVVFPLGLEIGRSAGAAATHFETRFDWALVTDQQSARLAASHVNERTSDEDVVIVSPHVTWLYRARAVDFFQAVAWTGEAIAFYPAGLNRARFAFDPSVAGARYAVLDPFWQRWAEASDPLRRITAQVEAWPEVYRAGPFSVRQNPHAG